MGEKAEMECKMLRPLVMGGLLVRGDTCQLKSNTSWKNYVQPLCPEGMVQSKILMCESGVKSGESSKECIHDIIRLKCGG